MCYHKQEQGINTSGSLWPGVRLAQERAEGDGISGPQHSPHLHPFLPYRADENANGYE